jgi:preprotein translocase subunit SecY
MGLKNTSITSGINERWRPIEFGNKPMERAINLRMGDGLNVPFSLAGYQLAIVELVPTLYSLLFYFGGTCLLIIVSVTMDTVAQIQSQFLAHQYEGLIRKTRGKNRR